MAKPNFVRTYKNFGLWYSLNRAYQLVLHLPIRGLKHYVDRVAGKRGLEVGGPSQVFTNRGLLPLYDRVGSLDNCNFGVQTLWAIHRSGTTFRYSARKPPGRQFVGEASDLSEIKDEAYDFILSAHMLEHSANPLKVLNAWRRVLKPNGSLVLLLPDKRWTFDHKRPVTSLAHLTADMESQMREDDKTHLPEVLALHDIARDPDAGDYAQFKNRSENNFESRGMHHHVFDPALVRGMLEQAEFSVLSVRTAFKDHIIAVGEKISGS